MKNQTKNFLKSLVSLALCLSMVLCTPLMAYASETDTFNYVSLGASNTNGYGMRGYITEEELNAMLSGQVNKNEVNVYGYQRTPEGAYPDLIRDHYVGIYGEDKVKVDQLAISSMRVEELHILLDDNYMGDDYSSWRFTGNDGWFRSAEEGGIPALREAYQDSIKNADLITVDIGWNNFGVYVCNQLVDYMTNGSYKWTTNLADIYKTETSQATEEQLAAAEEAKLIIKQYIVNTIGEGDMANALADIFAYSIIGYMYHFDACMEIIYDLNPDADVVVLGIQNLLYGAVVEINGELVPLGSIFGNFVNMANYYSSACSPYQTQYQYSKVGNDEHVVIFLDYMKNYNGDAEHLNQNVKDCFDYYDDSLYIQTRIDYFAADKFDKEYKDLYPLLGVSNGMEAVAKGKQGQLGIAQSSFDDSYWPALYAAYDTLAELVKVVANYPHVSANGLLAGTVDLKAVENQLKAAMEAEVTENASAASGGNSYTVDIDKILPDDNAKVVAAMYIRYYLGNSFFAHPNEEGHAEIKNAVVDVMNNPENEKDQALSDYLIESVEDMHEIICGGNGHIPEFDYAVESTCKDEGFEGAICSCGKEKSGDVIEKKEHTYGEPVWAWAEEAYTATATFTCSVCDETAENHSVTLDAEIAVESTDPTCTTDGKTTYTASVEFNGATYSDVKEETIPCTNEHNYVDDICTMCGQRDPDAHGECVYDEEAELSSGSELVLELNGNKAGTYTFSESEGKWSIKNSEGKFLAASEGSFAETSEEFFWNYDETGFSTTVTTTEKVPSGNTFIDLIFGGITQEVTKTYYLGYSENGFVVSETETAASFSKTVVSSTHEFETVTVEATCTENGYTALVCTRCGYEYVQETVEALGHAYSETVVEATCEEGGYTVHTCANCGDSYTDSETPALGHEYEDGVCKNCGEEEYNHGACEYLEETELKSGENHVMTLGGENVGEYTFNSVSGGWTIMDSNGDYLGADSNGALIRSEKAFTWTYSNGSFSTVITRTGSSWIEIILGFKTETTYYLVASNGNVTTSTAAAKASFYEKVVNEKHDFVETTVELTCTQDGYTEYNCTRCDYSYVTDVVTASGHNYEDGVCTVCGASEKPEEPECVYTKEYSLTSGETFILTLGGNNVGEYTFNSVSGGWTILNADGKYLAVANRTLTLSDSAYTWTYSNNRFSTRVSSSNWWDIIVGGGSSATYYLAANGSDVTVSTSTASADAKFYKEESGEHSYGDAVSSNGNHVYTCVNCGSQKTEACNDDNCPICNKVASSVDVSVKITENSSNNWWDIIFGNNRKTYTASITAVASGADVESVEYSLDGTNWTKGTSFTSSEEITEFDIRVKTSDGEIHNFEYKNGTVSEI